MGLAYRQPLSHVFREEAFEHLDGLNRSLLALEERGVEEALISDILRVAHNLKGAAKLVGALNVERLAHALEAMMVELQSGRVPLNRECIDAALEAVDSIRTALHDEEALPGKDPDSIANRLLAIAATGASPEEPFEAAFPALDPMVAAVLADSQRSQLLLEKKKGKGILEIELRVAPDEFAAKIDDFLRDLRTISTVVSIAGLAPDAQGQLRFKFVVTSESGPGPLRDFCRALTLTAVDPTGAVETEAAPAPAVAAPGGSSAEEEFSREMARLLEQYISEHIDEFDDFSKTVLQLDKRPNDMELVNELFRRAHSLKGTGTTFGLPTVSRVSHHVEAVLDALRRGKLQVTPPVVDTLLRAADTLRELFQSAKSGSSQNERPIPILDELDGLLQSKPAPAEPAATAEAAPNERPRPVLVPAPVERPVASAEAPVKMSMPSELSGARESIRVRLDKLDRLVNLASELTLSHNTRDAAVRGLEAKADSAKRIVRYWQSLLTELQSGRDDGSRVDALLIARLDNLGGKLRALQNELETLWKEFEATTTHAENTVLALQGEILRIRMVPISLLFDTAPRLVRDLTRDGKKQVIVEIAGGQTELDKRVLEQMADPLMHILRNAVDHGLESVTERTQAGKSPRGTIQLSAEHRGNQIVISISDDGRGIDPQRLVAKAKQMGIVPKEEGRTLSREDAYDLMFLPGFSTKEEVTEISGRGVGMDVVKKNIEKLKGSIVVESEVGRGTTFRILLPLSLAVVQAVFIDCGPHRLCLPTDSIEEIIQLDDKDIRTVDGRPAIFHRDRTLPVASLARLLEVEERHAPNQPLRIAVIQGVVRGKRESLALVIEKAKEEQSIVLKEPGRLFKRIPHMAGVTILSDGRVALVLDAGSLIASALESGEAWQAPDGESRPEVERKRLMVVDDSFTIRELFRGMLEVAGYEVLTAKNGREALETIQRRRVDLVVSDIQMPEMDGYELVRSIKSNEKLSSTPVVLVSSLAKDEERLRGLQAGADAYIVKGAFDQNSLLKRIEGLVG